MYCEPAHSFGKPAGADWKTTLTESTCYGLDASDLSTQNAMEALVRGVFQIPITSLKINDAGNSQLITGLISALIQAGRYDLERDYGNGETKAYVA